MFGNSCEICALLHTLNLYCATKL